MLIESAMLTSSGSRVLISCAWKMKIFSRLCNTLICLDSCCFSSTCLACIFCNMASPSSLQENQALKFGWFIMFSELKQGIASALRHEFRNHETPFTIHRALSMKIQAIDHPLSTICSAFFAWTAGGGSLACTALVEIQRIFNSTPRVMVLIS